ncbi:pol-like protein [Aspergillus lentulus]|nr:pol-like protein [Aspergillus lentulus]
MEQWRQAEQVVVGDFNLHHPYWGGLMTQRADPEAEETLQLIENFDLGLLYEAGTVTRGSESTIDLSLATPRLQDSLVRCLPREDLDHDSDHIPLETIFAKPTLERTLPEKWKWELTDKERLHHVLAQNLPDLRTLTTKQDIDNATKAIVNAILVAVKESTPKARVSPRSIPGWTRECKEAQQLARRLRRRYQRERTPEAWEAYRRARNHKARLIRKTLRDHHRKRVKEATSSLDSLWRIARWARSREPRTILVPPLQRPDGGLETDATKKLEMFKEAFFLPPPEVDLTDIRGFEYPSLIQLPPITLREVTEAIRLTLRKPGKGDYGQLKSYRPVALLNTLGKVMESILARRLSYVVEKHNLLPPQHMGGRRGVSTEQAIHILLERIHTTWKLMPSHVASVLFLDVSGAFDHVSHTRLLHNLRKRKIDRDIVGWIASFLGNRTTTIRMGGIESEPYTVAVGIPQGSPLSPILYLFYNADLLEAAADSDIQTSGWIDDVYFFTSSTSTEQNCRNLERAHRRAEAWARTHGSKFSPTKYQLMHFTRSRTKVDVAQTMRVADAEIKPAKTATYLGITLDPALRWEDQVKQVERKATPFLKPLTTLAGSTWGAGLIQLRRI